MRRVVTLFIAAVFIGVTIPVSRASSQTTESNMWNGALSVKTAGDITQEVASESPFCDFRDVSQKRVIKLIDSFIPITKLFKSAERTDLENKCVFENDQGLFTEHNNQLLYSSQFNGSFFGLYPRSGSGVIEYMPAPSGQYVLSQFRNSPFQGSATLGFHPSWREDTSFKLSGNEYLMHYKTSGFSLSYAGGDGYTITHDAYAFSESGRYVVVSRGSYIDKIDLKELTLTPVAYLTTPKSTRLAISNDGRYVAFGKNTYLNVADTKNCELVFERGTWQKVQQLQYSGCEISADVTDSLFDQGLLPLSIPHEFSRPYFSPNGSSIFLTARSTPQNESGPVWEELQITADEYESTASGYIALGDSFTSGEGDTEGGEWYEPGTDEQGDIDTFAGRNLCHLSRRSYPYLMALELGYLASNAESPPQDGLFRSVACSGAKIQNIIGGALGLADQDAGAELYGFSDNQYRFNRSSALLDWQPGFRAQKSYLEQVNPEVITLGIGGNDADFGGFMEDCLGLGDCSISEPGSEEAGWLGIRIAAQKDNLVRTYKQVKQKAPNARVYVHGYPQFINDRSGGFGDNISSNSVCGLNVRLSQREREMGVAGVAYMNQIVQAAAQEAGVFYIDIENVLDGGKLCDEAESDELLVNGITAGDDIDFSLCKLRSGCFGNETYHPNSEGHRKYSDRILLFTNNLTAAMPEPVSQEIPAPPSVFGAAANEYVQNQNISIFDDTAVPKPTHLVDDASSSAELILSYRDLLPGSLVDFEIRSTPTSLGSYTVNAEGEINEQILIPEVVTPGIHTVYMTGIDKFGEKISVYESIYIASSTNDFDGDSVDNDVDSCPTVPNSAVDKDEDGIDDTCDSEVVEPPEPPEEPKQEEKSVRQRIRTFFRRVITWFLQSWSFDSFRSGFRWGR